MQEIDDDDRIGALDEHYKMLTYASEAQIVGKVRIYDAADSRLRRTGGDRRQRSIRSSS